MGPLAIIPNRGFSTDVVRRKNTPLNGNSPRDDAWAASPTSTSSSSPRPPLMNSPVPRVLLLAMLALGARFTTKGVEPPPARGELWQGGQQYFNDARAILRACGFLFFCPSTHTVSVVLMCILWPVDTIVHESRPSTCQALLLLGHREFGLGSMEQGWLYFGGSLDCLLHLTLTA